MNSAELYNRIIPLCRTAEIQFGDDEYSFPAPDWVYSNFGGGLMDLLNFLNDSKYTPESNDCDDFTRLAACFAQVANNLTPWKPNNTALAFGEFWYQRRDSAEHAINIFFSYNGEILTPYFFEPQGKTTDEWKINLTTAEIQSATFIRF